MRGIRLCAQILGSLLILGLKVPETDAAEGTRLLCDCTLNHKKTSQLVVACSKIKIEDTRVSCSKDVVPRISKGYRYVPGYGLFKFFKTFKLWEDAKKTCEQEGGSLYIPKDNQLTAILSNIYKKAQYFAGLTDSASEGIFVGVDKQVYLDLKWAPNEPNGDRKENCVTVVFEGLLNDNDCGSWYPFVCQRKLNNLPPEGYVYSDGFGFFKVYGDKKSFEDAQRTCENDGGNLAVPDTYEKAEALADVVNNDPQRLYDLWIGLNDTVQEGRFTTASGRPLSSMEFDNWRINEPNNKNNEDCVVFFYDGTINDDVCDYKHNFLCELSLAAV